MIGSAMEIKWSGIKDSAVEVMSYGGNDELIYYAAKLTRYQSDEIKPGVDTKGFLLSLMRMGHLSPFEHCSISYELHCPIFVFRQIFRHRTAKICELSLRATDAVPEFYLPDSLYGARATKYKKTIEAGYKAYTDLLESGISKQTARCLLPVSLYSTALMTFDLRNLFHFFDLRLAKGAQWETRFIANRMLIEGTKHFPLAFGAYIEKNGIDVTELI